MIEPDPKDIQRYKRSLFALYEQEGKSVSNLIEYTAEAMAFLEANSRHNQEILMEIIKEERQRCKK